MIAKQRNFRRLSAGTCVPALLLLLLSCAGGTARTDAEPSHSADAGPVQDGAIRYEPQMGVNYNGQFRFIDFEDIERTQTTWVRGFMDLFEYEADPALADAQIAAYRQVRPSGYNTLLNIKFNFHGRSFPAPGSEEIERHKRMLGKLLDRVWDTTDIIVVGNEPFIESKAAEQDERLVRYYEELTRYTIRYRQQKPRKLPIYVGSFQNLYQESRRNNIAARKLLQFAKNTVGVAGIDLHIHHKDPGEIDSALNHVSDKIRSDQRILISEFSLMHHWRLKMGETIPASFAQSYGLPATMKNFEYIDTTLVNSVPRAEWVDFLKASYWFENRTSYLKNAYQRMARFEKFYIATYGIRQSYPPNRTFQVNDDPWILNALYANRTVANPDGRTRFNYAFIDDFRGIQTGAIVPRP